MPSDHNLKTLCVWVQKIGFLNVSLVSYQDRLCITFLDNYSRDKILEMVIRSLPHDHDHLMVGAVDVHLLPHKSYFIAVTIYGIYGTATKLM